MAFVKGLGGSTEKLRRLKHYSCGQFSPFIWQNPFFPSALLEQKSFGAQTPEAKLSLTESVAPLGPYRRI